MSIKLLPGAARLTVLGSGYSNSSVESGDGLTEDGRLWQDIAGDLGYDFGDNVDWDQIAGDGIDWSDVVYTDSGGNIYTSDEAEDVDADLDTWVPEETILGISDSLEATAVQDATLNQYAIDAAVLKTLYGGKVSEEDCILYEGSERPHKFAPPVYYIQQSATDAVLFLDEPFYHATALGGDITVNDKAITIRDGSTKAVYWSSCSTFFSDNVLPSEYSWMPIQYICWQCLHGSFNHVLVSSNPNTITTSMIQAGEALYETMTIDGKTYYKLIR